uniref:Caveolin n=1 Tax=Trichuris muris TaxID=70415 RepID=A0A5S6QV98_TRIMR
MSTEEKTNENGLEPNEPEAPQRKKKEMTKIRDPNGLNDHLKVTFDDIIAEPDTHSRSIEQVWNVSNKTFEIISTWCYRVLSLVFALPCAILWATLFALVSFISIWFFQPLVQTFHLLFVCVFQGYEKLISGLLGPIGSAMGRCFENVRLFQITTTTVKPNEPLEIV